MEEKARQVAELLKILANENRLLIVCALMEGPKTVGGIAKKVTNITQSALSQHLAILRAHNILSNQRAGQSITYSIADSRIEILMDTIKKNYCDPEDIAQ